MSGATAEKATRKRRTCPPGAASRAVVAEELGMTERRVGQLVADGVLQEAELGFVDLLASLGSVWARGKSSADREDYEKARARLTSTQADLAEMKRALRSGELLERSQVKAGWGSIVMRIKARFRGLPTRAAPRLVTMREIREAEAFLKAEVDEVLRELAKP